MGKNKLQHFEENKGFTNLFQHNYYDAKGEGFPLKGCWNSQYFNNNNPIILELGCGKGEYTLALAERNRDFNYIGVDRKGARLWRGAKTAFEAAIPNVAFLRISIEDIMYYFGEEEISEIWITFPDPQPEKERKRLVSPHFIEKYRLIIKPDGLIHLKTDSRFLYQYTQERIMEERWNKKADIEDIYRRGEQDILSEVQTFYERRWILEGKIISYLSFGIG